MQAAFVVVLALVAVANAGLLAAPLAVAPAPIAYHAPILTAPAPVVYRSVAPVVHAAPIAVPVATSHTYKVRAPAAKILAPAAVVHSAPVLLH